MSEKQFYDWDRTLTYSQARTYAVFGAKNIGKTFGLRLKSIQRYLDTGLRMAEIDRAKAALPDISKGYFMKIQEAGFFPDCEFKTTPSEMYVKRPGSDEWETMGYFVALTDLQGVKKRNCLARGNIIFDEAVIDSRNKRYHNYLKNEIELLANVVDTITREDETDPSTQTAKLFLLGNSCDLHTPYLEWLGIDRVPDRYGYQWCRGHTAVLHFPDPTNVELKKKNTLSGQMLKGTDEGEMVFENRFKDNGERQYLGKKTSSAKFWAGIQFDGERFGIWFSTTSGLAFVNRKIPSDGTVVCLCMDDGRIDYKIVNRCGDMMNIVKSLYQENSLRYDTITTKGKFARLLKFLGVA